MERSGPEGDGLLQGERSEGEGNDRENSQLTHRGHRLVSSILSRRRFGRLRLCIEEGGSVARVSLLINALCICVWMVRFQAHTLIVCFLLICLIFVLMLLLLAIGDRGGDLRTDDLDEVVQQQDIEMQQQAVPTQPRSVTESLVSIANSTGDDATARFNAGLRERLKQLEERSRICTRRVWEEIYLPAAMRGLPDDAPRPPTAECTICMSRIDMAERIRGLACGHIFHVQCVGEWFVHDRSFELCCPLCRIPLSQQREFRDFEPDVS